MGWEVKIDIRAQSEHDLWESSVKTGQFLTRV